MDKQEPSTKKRKVTERDSQKLEAPVVAVPKPPGRTRRVGKSRKHQESASGPKPLLRKPKEQREVVNRELTESGEDEPLDGPEVANRDNNAGPSLASIFLDLHIAPGIQKAISAMGLSEMREIQRNSIPFLLTGKDVSLFFTTPHSF